MPHGINNDSTPDAPKISPKFAQAAMRNAIPEEQVVAQEIPKEDIPEVPAVPVSMPKNNGNEKVSQAKSKVPRTERIGFEATKAEKKLINSAKIDLDVPVTQFAREAVLAYVCNGYVCAACGNQFTLVVKEGTKVKPKACPVCLSTKFSRLVRA